MSLPAFTLQSATTNAAAPFTLGHAFVKGDVPAGSQVVAPFVDFQCVPKNTWPDGSLKFAILSGKASLTANTPLSVQLSIGTPSGGTALPTADLKAVVGTGTVDCGTFGAASWATTEWDSPFVTWVSGPKMSSWIYRKPVGSDPHLVAWLEVRLWAGGAVEVLPWIENGYLRVASPINKSATYGFTFGGTSRVSVAIDLKHHQRTPIINGAALAYWLGTDPGVTPLLDRAYLQLSELVPSYRATVAATEAAVTDQPSTYTPLQAGRFLYDADEMASSGYQRPIGLLPEHDVMYIVAASTVRAAIYASVVRNGFSAGRYAIHYRDETTNRPAKFSSYPTLNIGPSQGFKDTGGSTTGSYTPTPTGGNGPSWDVAHSPSVGYMAYLLTGRWYFMEEVQFATTANYLGNGDSAALRNGSQGLVKPEPGAWQTRSCAWDWRARVQALCVTPDADTALRNEFIASVESNITYFYNKYISATNNPWGFIKPGGFYDTGTREEAVWMQDFVTAAFGWSVSMDLPISSTKKTQLTSFFQWKAKSTVMRLGPSTGFWYINADAYTGVISPSANPDWDGGTGPWYTTEADVYYNTFHGSANYPTPPTWFGSTEGVLAGEFASVYWPTAQWGNIQPAIAYAVRHGVPGAQAGYDRMIGASNWGDLTAGFNTTPVWSVQPAAITGAAPVTFPQEPCVLLGEYNSGQTTVSKYPGGIPKAAVATGFANKSIFETQLVGDPSNMEYTVESVTLPASGTLVVNENGSGSLTGATDGARFASFGIGKFGVLDGTQTIEFDVGAIAPTVTGMTVTPMTPTVAGSATQAFTVTITGAGSPSQAVTWSKISGVGAFIGNTYSAPASTGSAQVSVWRATSTQDASYHVDVTITIPATASAVTGLSVAPTSATVAGGATQVFIPTVTGTGGYSSAVAWSKISGVGSFSGNTFTAPAGTSVDQVSVWRCTSTQDGAYHADVTITVPATVVAGELTLKTITVSLKSRGLTQQANVAGINWEWRDTRGEVTSYGSGLAANSAGEVSVPVMTALLSDGEGFLTLDNYNGGNSLTYFGFTGPVRVP